jgi:hypothetical protein
VQPQEEQSFEAATACLISASMTDTWRRRLLATAIQPVGFSRAQENREISSTSIL